MNKYFFKIFGILFLIIVLSFIVFAFDEYAVECPLRNHINASGDCIWDVNCKVIEIKQGCKEVYLELNCDNPTLKFTFYSGERARGFAKRINPNKNLWLLYQLEPPFPLPLFVTCSNGTKDIIEIVVVPPHEQKQEKREEEILRQLEAMNKSESTDNQGDKKGAFYNNPSLIPILNGNLTAPKIPKEKDLFKRLKEQTLNWIFDKVIWLGVLIFLCLIFNRPIKKVILSHFPSLKEIFKKITPRKK